MESVGSEESAVWVRAAAGDVLAREQLLVTYLPYAREVAARYFAKKGDEDIEFDEYLQFARVGLLECIDRFDPSLGVPFRNFAKRRIDGAILDGIERLTERRQQSAARKRWQTQRFESATDTPCEQGPSARDRQTEQMLAYITEAGMAFALSWLLDGTGMLYADDAQNIPFYGEAEARQVRSRLGALLDSLPLPEQKVLREHYFQERQFQDIAQSMSLTKGRISQIHHKALQRLKFACTQEHIGVHL